MLKHCKLSVTDSICVSHIHYTLKLVTLRTYTAAGNLVAREQATTKSTVLVDGAKWRRGKVNFI
jgi:uncharacterized protein (DUF2141 family)